MGSIQFAPHSLSPQNNRGTVFIHLMDAPVRGPALQPPPKAVAAALGIHSADSPVDLQCKQSVDQSITALANFDRAVIYGPSTSVALNYLGNLPSSIRSAILLVEANPTFKDLLHCFDLKLPLAINTTDLSEISAKSLACALADPFATQLENFWTRNTACETDAQGSISSKDGEASVPADALFCSKPPPLFRARYDSPVRTACQNEPIDWNRESGGRRLPPSRWVEFLQSFPPERIAIWTIFAVLHESFEFADWIERASDTGKLSSSGRTLAGYEFRSKGEIQNAFKALPSIIRNYNSNTKLEREELFSTITDEQDQIQLTNILSESGQPAIVLEFLQSLLSNSSTANVVFLAHRALTRLSPAKPPRDFLLLLSEWLIERPDVEYDAKVDAILVALGNQRCFERAGQFYAALDSKSKPHKGFYPRWASHCFTIGETDRVPGLLSRDKGEGAEGFARVLWQAKLLNYESKPESALKLLSEFEQHSTSAQTCFLSFEKGVSYRSIGDHDQACLFFETSLAAPVNNDNWNTMAAFELALTLSFRGKREKALAVLDQSLQSSRDDPNLTTNPCAVLLALIDKATSENDLAKCSNDALSVYQAWPLPHFHYQLWALALGAMTQFKNANANGGIEFINRLLADPFMSRSSDSETLIGQLENSTTSNSNLWDSVSAIWWPHHAKDSFEGNILKKLSLTD